MVILYILGFVLFFYLGTVLSKYFYISINRYDFYSIFSNDFSKLSKKYILNPLLNYSFLKTQISSQNLKKDKYPLLIKLSLACEILGGFVLGFLSLSIINSFNVFSNFALLIYIAITVSFTAALLYLAVYDIITFSIPDRLIKILALSALGINLIVGLIKFLSENIGSPLLVNLPFGNIGNLFSGVLFALLIWLVVKISKEKAMGEGDVYLVLIIGLILGWPQTLVSYFATLILGSVISLIISKYIGKFKGVIIPFVPFLLLGFVIALSFGSQIHSYIFRL